MFRPESYKNRRKYHSSEALFSFASYATAPSLCSKVRNITESSIVLCFKDRPIPLEHDRSSAGSLVGLYSDGSRHTHNPSAPHDCVTNRLMTCSNFLLAVYLDDSETRWPPASFVLYSAC